VIAPERRTRVDIIAAAVIAVVVAVTGVTIWWTSDARATVSHPAARDIKRPMSATRVPDSVRELWSATSGATKGPVIASGAVVSADGHEVVAHDPVTGAQLWSYARRNLDLCGAIGFIDDAVAVYRDARGCGQVTMIDGQTGRRGPLRSSPNDPKVSLSTDGTYVLALGSTRLELWRSDMVRTLEYGRVVAPLNPNSQPRVDCTLKSGAVGSSVLAVLETCPQDSTLRLTLQKPTPKDNDKPEELYSAALPGVERGSAAKVLAVADTRSAVYLPGTHNELVVFDDHGMRVGATALPGEVVQSNTAAQAGDVVTWWTGNQVLVLGGFDLSYRFVLPTTKKPLGPGTAMAGELLIPVEGGIDVFNMATGEFRKSIAVHRDPADEKGPVISAVVGNTLVEQRGSRVFALG
jgi:hypothetical protein